MTLRSRGDRLHRGLETDRVRNILQRAGIPSIVDDHSMTLIAGSRTGMIHVLVLTKDADNATTLLKKESASWLRPAPPA